MRSQVSVKLLKKSRLKTVFEVTVPHEIDTKFFIDGKTTGELQLDDGRSMSSMQNKKIHALIRDILRDRDGTINDFSYEKLKHELKLDFLSVMGGEYFSFVNVDMTTASHFISFLIDYCLVNGVPLYCSPYKIAEDIERLVFSCLRFRKCTLCGKKGEIHHWDAIGMGNDRTEYNHSKSRLICLCREHHNLAHNMGKKTFYEKFHVAGIKLSSETLKKLNIGGSKNE